MHSLNVRVWGGGFIIGFSGLKLLNRKIVQNDLQNGILGKDHDF